MKKLSVPNLVVGIVVLIVLIFLVLFLVGCDDTGNTATVNRYATGSRGGGDGKQNAWIWYIDTFGQPLEMPGLRFRRETPDVTYCEPYPQSPDIYWDCGGIALEGANVTGEGGRIHIRGVFDASGTTYPAQWAFRCSGVWRGPITNGTSIAQCVSFATWGGVPWYMRPDYAHPTWNRPPKTKSTSQGSLSSAAQAALSASTQSGGAMMMSFSDPNTITLPGNGFTYTCTLVQQNGTNGYGYSLPMESGFMITDSNSIEDNFRYQSPLMYSLIAVSAAPADVIGRTFGALVKSNACPDGIPVAAVVVAQNDEQTVHIVHTEYFLAVSPQDYDVLKDIDHTIFDRWSDIGPDEAHWYDPNNFPDPNCPPYTLDTEKSGFMQRYRPERVKPLHYIPAFPQDELRMRLIPTGDSISLLSESWLFNNVNLDLNNDGIVNLKDLNL